MNRAIVVIGGGEHARVVMSAIRTGASGGELAGFVDPQPCVETVKRFGVRRLGDDSDLRSHPGAHVVLGFGALDSAGSRQEAVRRVTPMVKGWATIVHQHAWISPQAVVGEGSVVMAAAVVQTGARVGAHCVVNTSAVIEHDVILEDFVQVAPGAILGGGVRVGPAAYIGMGAVIRDHTNIGAGAVVGMGAVVVADVADGARVIGVPAR
ncbi:MAG TPA: NeuD/PglB/VioB family sugar acetyltransferase [Gemmatimonadales bacterium]|nr:NeuD/PglB/VioB family sugar acetyltransferase [Gemmatimonadales bacterium]